MWRAERAERGDDGGGDAVCDGTAGACPCPRWQRRAEDERLALVGGDDGERGEDARATLPGAGEGAG